MSEVEFFGETFRTADKIGLMPLMRFAKVAKVGTDSNDLDGLVAMYDLIEQCLADDEWDRFQAHASAKRADGDDFMGVVKQVFEVLAERPTVRPSDSSAGPSSTEQSSTDDSSSRVIERLEAESRPAWALIALNEKQSRTA